ncbi:MAG: response regulator [Myxococcales bacterium]|nr:response regulator [Myxococcales bacterium]
MRDSLSVLFLLAVLLEALRLAVFGFLAVREKDAALRLWTLGFMVQTLAQLGMAPGLMGRPWAVPHVLGLLCLLALPLFLLHGTWRLLGRTPSRWWWLASGVTFAGVLALWGAGVPFTLATALSVAFLCFAYFQVARVLIQRRAQFSGLGVWLTVTGITLTAVHFADFPFLAETAWFVPLGITLATFNDMVLGVGFVVLHFDRTRAAQQQVQARDAELAESIGLGTFEAGSDGHLRQVNGALVRLLGYDSAAEVLALPLLAPLSSSAVGDRLPAVRATWPRKDGAPRFVEIHGRAMRGTDGQLSGFRGFVVDRTEAHALEEVLRRTQKLDAVGHLAGGVAHDFNNLLTVIRSSLELVRADASEKEALASAVEATEQAAQLTRRLLAFGRKQPLRPEPVDVAASALRTAQMVASTLGDRHPLDTSALTRGLWAKLDPGQLEQVVLNLVLNARDAQPDGGAVHVATRGVQRDGVPGVELIVRDEGVGMSAAVQAHVFEPFFTTKGPGRGTGLGLATVHAIVAQAGGHIDLTSAPGEGTTFALWFPAVSAPAAPGADAAHVQPGAARTRVLVVDDEPGIRRAVRRLLEAAGFDVVEAASGNEALRRFEGGERFDVLLSDMRMPDGDGSSTAGAVRRLAPGTRVVLMSGFHERLDDDALACAHHFLAKPFSQEALLAALRGSPEASVLAEEPPEGATRH